MYQRGWPDCYAITGLVIGPEDGVFDSGLKIYRVSLTLGALINLVEKLRYVELLVCPRVTSSKSHLLPILSGGQKNPSL